MKKLVITTIVLLMAVVAVFAQPQSFKYQAVARDAGGQLMANEEIGVRVSILFEDASGAAVYVEEHTVETDVFGLFDMRIGEGAPTSGVFSAIDWGAGDYFVKLDVDLNGGTAYSYLGTSQLLAVPFAKYAEKAGEARFPAGMIISFAGDTAKIPEGWLLCDGREIERTEYSDLLDAIGIGWGPGNGVNTFNLPDLRGTFLRGVDLGAGRDPDAATRYSLYPTGNEGDKVASYQDGATGAPNNSFLLSTDGDHSHAGNTTSEGDHSHTGNTTSEGDHSHTGNTTSSGSHSHSGSTFSAGSHNHYVAYGNSISGSINGDLNSTETLVGFGNIGMPGQQLYNNNHEYELQGKSGVTANRGRTNSTGSHTHNLNINSSGSHAHILNVDSTGIHTHNLNIDSTGIHVHDLNIDSSGTHSHSFTGGGDNETRPINAYVHYIIKY